MTENKQIKSKKRVADHGEVFTAEREVNAMLDLVKQETERIESRFLEPACGNGNFLTAILGRKLDVVAKNYKKSKPDYEKYSILALTSIYGVDIQEDNVMECRERLLDQWEKAYKKMCKEAPTQEVKDVAEFILKKNILCGDALTLLRNNGDPIIFAQWDFVMGDKIKRMDYRLDDLMQSGGENEQLSFSFDDSYVRATEWEYDPEIGKLMPKPIKEYDAVSYLRLKEVDENE